MAKYKVIAARTMFMVMEVEANSEDEAINRAWEIDPTKWSESHLSNECEHHAAITPDDNEWQYWE